MSKRFYIEDAAKFHAAGETVVTVKGWVHNKRSSGKIKFMVVRDGTGFMQAVLVKGECQLDDTSFEGFEKLTQESSVIVTGSLRANPRQPGVFGADGHDASHALKGALLEPCVFAFSICTCAVGGASAIVTLLCSRNWLMYAVRMRSVRTCRIFSRILSRTAS